MTGFGELDQKCKKTVEHFKREVSKIRSGRASSGLLENIQVDYYGSQVPLLQLGMINAPEPRLITVQAYDAGAVEAIEKAIRQSDLGLNPSRDGALLRINIPTLTNDRRKELTKMLNKMGEETRVAIRGHRREEIDVLKTKEKNKEISQDDRRKGEEDIQKVTDRFIAEIDQLVSAKEKEILEV